jgi:mRNA-degrading endonuclease RelE of RelBE toxin-antitoxin system
MILIETKIFTKRIIELLDDESYREFQMFLCNLPESGKLIKGINGLRKIRWNTKTKGKSGGIRIIYYFITKKDTIILLYSYPKSEQDDLSQSQLNVINKLLKEFEK